MKNKHNFKKISATLFFSAVLFFSLCIFASAKSTVITTTGYDEQWNDVTVYVEAQQTYEFCGSEIEPEISVYVFENGNKVYLTEDVDYQVISYDSSEPGSYEAYIESLEDSRYYFWYELDYSISFDASKLRADDIPAKTYTGKAIKPAVKVYYGSILLDKSFYYVDYYDCYDVGSATAEIEFGWRFDDYTIYKYFDIKPVSADKVTISAISPVTYNGDSHMPDPKITFGGETLDEGWDYSVSYKNNVNAGTASATIKFKGNFKGTKTIEFTIKKADASKVKVSGISTQRYNGSKIKPEIYAYIGWYDLEEKKDYTVTYSNNTNPGTATATLKFNGKNITGSKKVTFKIAVGEVYWLSADVNATQIDMYWYTPENYKYKVYKYDDKEKKYVCIKTQSANEYTDKDVKELKTYKYRVRAYVKIGDTVYYGPYSDVTVKTSLFPPKTVTLKTVKDSVTVKWSKCSKATGYYVMRYDTVSGTSKKVYTAKKNTELSYVDKSVKNYRNYIYTVIAYKTENGKTTKSGNSISVSSLDVKSITRGVTLKSKKSYKIYDTQGSKTKLYSTVNLSSKDIETLKKFASKHFKSGWTAEQKVEYTLNWIHSNVTYASSSQNWNKICNKTYVDAIFNYKLGQCAQYNGALAGMMTYLGYDVQMLKGHRQSSSGKKNQHFWTECKLGGLTYVMECGNKKDGSWHYYFEPYNNTMGYTKNGKYVSGR